MEVLQGSVRQKFTLGLVPHVAKVARRVTLAESGLKTNTCFTNFAGNAMAEDPLQEEPQRWWQGVGHAPSSSLDAVNGDSGRPGPGERSVGPPAAFHSDSVN